MARGKTFNDNACASGAVCCDLLLTLVQDRSQLSCVAQMEVSWGSRDPCRGARATPEAEKVPRSQETALSRREMLWKALKGVHLLKLAFVFGEGAVFS